MTPDTEKLLEDAAIQVLVESTGGAGYASRLPPGVWRRFQDAIWQDPIWFAQAVLERMKNPPKSVIPPGAMASCCQ